MPLETFNYLDSLVVTNPDVNDGLVNGDDHIRGIKLALKNTFPNVAGAITATQTDINTVAAWASHGASVLKGAGTYFDGNPTDGWQNTLAGDIDVVLQGSIAGTFQLAGGVNFLKWHGPATFDGEIKGPGTIPIGGMIMWLSDTLPPTTNGVWAWANGQAISRTTYSVLFGMIGTNFGGGDNSTTFNLINMQEAVPVGKTTMGGAAPTGFLGHISQALRAVVGSLFGEGQHTQSQAEMPLHYHAASISDPGHVHSSTYDGFQLAIAAGSAIGLTGSSSRQVNIGASTFSVNGASTGVRVSSANGLDTTYSSGGGNPFNVTQPSRVVNYIIRIA